MLISVFHSHNLLQSILETLFEVNQYNTIWLSDQNSTFFIQSNDKYAKCAPIRVAINSGWDNMSFFKGATLF